MEAIELALRAQAFDRAARLLDELGLFDKGQAGALEHLAQRIPKEVSGAIPEPGAGTDLRWEADWNFTRSRAGFSRIKRVLRNGAAGNGRCPAR